MIPSHLPSAVVASALAGSAALAEDPAVYWVSAPVQPGETVMMCGFFPQPDDLEVALERLPDQKPGEPSGRPWKLPADRDLPEAVKPLQASETALMFELPADEQGVFFYALHSGAANRQLRAHQPSGALVDARRRRHRPHPFRRLAPRGRRRPCRRAGLRIVGRCLKLGEKEPAVALRSDDGRCCNRSCCNRRKPSPSPSR